MGIDTNIRNRNIVRVDSQYTARRVSADSDDVDGHFFESLESTREQLLNHHFTTGHTRSHYALISTTISTDA